MTQAKSFVSRRSLRHTRHVGALLRARGATLGIVLALGGLFAASSRPEAATSYATPRSPSRRDGLVAAASGLMGVVAGSGPVSAANRPIVTLYVDVEGNNGPDTEQVRVQLRPDWAPRGVKRFLEMAELGDLTDTAFFHVEKDDAAKFGWPAEPSLPYRPIKDDVARASNKRGRVSFTGFYGAKRVNELFINYKDNSDLDMKGVAPIGEVLDNGMDVLDKLYDGYGTAPSQELVKKDGNEYLDKEFPRLPKIKMVSVSA